MPRPIISTTGSLAGEAIEAQTRYVAKLGVDLPGLLVSIRMTAFVS